MVQHTPWAVAGGTGRFSFVGADASSACGRPQAAPTENASFSRVRPLGEFHKGGPEAPFWSFQGERVLRERGKFEIPLSLSGSLVTFCPHRKSLARRRNIPKTVLNLFRRADEDIGPYENVGKHTRGRPHGAAPTKE